jgi:hypothetical protein
MPLTRVPLLKGKPPEKHLHRYVAEFDFRYNNRVKLGCGDTMRAERVLSGVKGSVSHMRDLIRDVRTRKSRNVKPGCGSGLFKVAHYLIPRFLHGNGL